MASEVVAAGQAGPRTQHVRRASAAAPLVETVTQRGALAAILGAAMLIVGCGGGDGLKASLRDDDRSTGYWAIRASCMGGELRVEFRPGERLSVAGVARASSDEIAVECGDPERVSVTNRELRRRSATPTGADLAAPSFGPVDVSCTAGGSFEVEVHPVWSHDRIVGGGLRVESGGHTLVTGAIARKEGFPSELRWWRALCNRR